MNVTEKLNAVTVAKLKKLAEELNVNLDGIYRKDDIIEAIEQKINGVGEEGPMGGPASSWGPLSAEIFGEEEAPEEEITDFEEDPVDEPEEPVKTEENTEPIVGNKGEKGEEGPAGRNTLTRTQMRNMSHQDIEKFFKNE